MKKKWLHKILAIILLGVFALHITPRELIHQFAPHHDTQDNNCDRSYSGLAFSVKHQHCDFLQIGVEPYEQVNASYHAAVREVAWVYTPPYVPAAEKPGYSDLSLRAPPAVGLC